VRLEGKGGGGRLEGGGRGGDDGEEELTFCGCRFRFLSFS
jgi:hypothetical protein